MMQCPHCGSRQFQVEGPLTIWNVQHITCTADGNVHIDDEVFGDTVATQDWAIIMCDACDTHVSKAAAAQCFNAAHSV
jgi:hypothetical protein